jgi:hypothetical protein
VLDAAVAVDDEGTSAPEPAGLGNRLLAWPEDIYVLLEKFAAEHEADFT